MEGLDLRGASVDDAGERQRRISAHAGRPAGRTPRQSNVTLTRTARHEDAGKCHALRARRVGFNVLLDGKRKKSCIRPSGRPTPYIRGTI